MSAMTIRRGGRYIRDAKTGEVVQEEVSRLGRQKVRAKPAAEALDPGSRDAAVPHTVRDDGGAARSSSKPGRS